MNDELETLKMRADQMGIPYHPNIGLETLRKKVQDKLDGNAEGSKSDDNDASVNAPDAPKQTKAQIEQALREKQWSEQLRLVRIRITCLNPLKKDLQGEIVTVANRFLGTVKKFIPFGEATDNGYHVPFVLLQELKSRRFNSVRTTKGDKGQIIVHQRMVPEFAIEELEPLSTEELDQLARQQAAAAGA